MISARLRNRRRERRNDMGTDYPAPGYAADERGVTECAIMVSDTLVSRLTAHNCCNAADRAPHDRKTHQGERPHGLQRPRPRARAERALSPVVAGCGCAAPAGHRGRRAAALRSEHVP